MATIQDWQRQIAVTGRRTCAGGGDAHRSRFKERRMRMWIAIAALALGCLGKALAAECDTRCLRGGLEQYLEALTKRDPKGLVLAPRLKYTENGSVGKVGEGLWAKATGLDTYRQVFADATTQQALFIGIVNEGSDPAIAAIRLGFAGGKIAEIEHVVARKGSHPLFVPAGLVTPHASLSAKIPPGKRLSRERLVEIADSYFEGIEKHDSKIILADEGCQRFENGTQTTGTPGNTSRNCAHSADLLLYITGVDDRRYLIVDVEHGVVVATILFDIPPGPETTGAGAKTNPRTLLLTEWFKIDDGKIQHIEAVMHNLPHGSKSGWEK
jgi:hypothetical protein